MGDLVPCPWDSEFSPKEEPESNFWMMDAGFIKKERMDDPFPDQPVSKSSARRVKRPSPLKLENSMLGNSFETFSSSNETSPDFSDHEVPNCSFK